jgi:hypothetical protein
MSLIGIRAFEPGYHAFPGHGILGYGFIHTGSDILTSLFISTVNL